MIELGQSDFFGMKKKIHVEFYNSFDEYKHKDLLNLVTVALDDIVNRVSESMQRIIDMFVKILEDKYAKELIIT